MTNAADIADEQFVLGQRSMDVGQLEQAEAHFRASLDADPARATTHYQLGSAYSVLGRHSEAAIAYLRALELEPDLVGARYDLGVTFLRLGRLLDALACFLRTTEIDPAHVEAYNGIGAALVQMGRGVDAIPAFERALAINPGHSLARAQLMFQLARLCAWDRLAPHLPMVPQLGIVGSAVPPFTMLAFEDDPARHRARSEFYAEDNYRRLMALPAPSRPAARPDRLRIGYFSSDFHEHATMFLAAGMFEMHDRERFSIHCYSYGHPSGDPLRSRLLAAVDGFHDISGIDNLAAAETARRDGIDIAIDLKGFTKGNRVPIFAHRAAPVQIGFLGYPGTSGAPFIDYLVVDRTVVPEEHRSAYSERLLFMPHCYQPNDDQRAIAGQRPTRSDVGLPEKSFVFCCFNDTYKISPVEFGIWMGLLKRIEASVLWLIAGTDLAITNLRAAAAAHGVDPDRLIFAARIGQSDHLARQRLADLFLDTFNCNAHTTASDALWAGLPVLTKVGEGFAARVAASLLTAVGMTDLIASSVEDYAELAFGLATNPDRLKGIRATLAANRKVMPLFDSHRFTRHLETGFDLAYHRYLVGEAAADIHIPA